MLRHPKIEPQAGMRDHLTENLRFLCTLFPSVAETCRRLELNRQQFNKYLSGQVRPSGHNMRKVCDFFGVTESEILMEPSRFEEIVSLRKRPALRTTIQEPLAHIESLCKRSGDLERYVGYYFRYHYSFSYPAMLVKSFMQISTRDGQYFCHTVEKIMHKGARKPTTNHYKGVLFLLADRIFVIEYQSMLKNSITEIILYPSYHPRVSLMTGIQTGAASVRGRRPAASRVLLEFLGKNIDRKRAIRSTGLFDERSDAIDPSIRGLVQNRIERGSYVLEVKEV